jgi:hypothetical protein
MAQLRVRVNNTKDLEAKFPKLKRTLSVQANVELSCEGNGVFLLKLLKGAKIKKLGQIIKNYNFEFYYPDEFYAPPSTLENLEAMPGCDCDMCEAIREVKKRKEAS